MTDDIRRQILREFPELAAGYHTPQLAEITAVPDAPAAGGISDNYRPRYAVTVEMLTSTGTGTGIQLDGVPVQLPAGGGAERGLFSLPTIGTLVIIQWIGGNPERPIITGTLGDRNALPHNSATGQTWQQANHQRQQIDAAGNWSRETDQTISDTADSISQSARLLAQTIGHENRRIHGHSHTDVTGTHTTEAAAIHMLAETVANILAAGSVNTVAGQHITASASGDIRQHATGQRLNTTDGDIMDDTIGNRETTTGGNSNSTTDGEHNTTAGTSASLTAPLIHIGPDGQNLLATISAALAQISTALTNISTMTVTCAAPGSASSVPINAAAFVAAQTAIDSLKSQLDAATK
ncbi:phage baseplate assembly protein V [Oceanobacter sp. 4_MG-2023]|uniref:phage baseplate assembly protein V n=1 Tax=Oceanobacter sp. 4_MG-2023 TaxID=3062623 RepID=UPI002736210C|nr:phage baseplate assembly protein V [Oceanobacter sp. 4_MG-2023]MDP2548911.1 phage baseplate assembly protein V [Oceanobacter sp. 4_MG-2023]